MYELSTPRLTGLFLGRLWALFGAPEDENGIVYAIEDVETGVAFSAYAAGSGPAFGGAQAPEVIAAVEAFEAYLDTIEPVPCRIRLDGDYGPMRYGWADGAAIDGPAD